MTLQRHLPSPSAARGSNIIVAVLVGVLMPVIGWFEGFEDVFWLLLIGLAAGLVTFAIYALIGRATGLAAIELDDTDLVIERRGQRVVIPWQDIASARLLTYGGETLVIRRHSGASQVSIRLDGHTPEAIAAIRAQIDARLIA